MRPCLATDGCPVLSLPIKCRVYTWRETSGCPPRVGLTRRGPVVRFEVSSVPAPCGLLWVRRPKLIEHDSVPSPPDVAKRVWPCLLPRDSSCQKKTPLREYNVFTTPGCSPHTHPQENATGATRVQRVYYPGMLAAHAPPGKRRRYLCTKGHGLPPRWAPTTPPRARRPAPTAIQSQGCGSVVGTLA